MIEELEPVGSEPVQPIEAMQTLAELEDEFRGLLGDFSRSSLAMGEILTEIRDRKLYLKSFKTFEDYCQGKWGFSARRGYQLIEGAVVVKSLPEPVKGLVKNEKTARVLMQVPEEKRVEVLEKASEEGEITAKSLKATANVNQISHPEIPAAPVPTSKPTPEFDALGCEIPSGILPVWHRARKNTLALMLEIERLERQVNQIQKDLPPDDLQWNGANLQKMESELHSMWFVLKQGNLPYIVCLKCQGRMTETCGDCRFRGYSGKHAWDYGDAELKRIRTAAIALRQQERENKKSK